MVVSREEAYISILNFSPTRPNTFGICFFHGIFFCLCAFRYWSIYLNYYSVKFTDLSRILSSLGNTVIIIVLPVNSWPILLFWLEVVFMFWWRAARFSVTNGQIWTKKIYCIWSIKYLLPNAAIVPTSNTLILDNNSKNWFSFLMFVQKPL